MIETNVRIWVENCQTAADICSLLNCRELHWDILLNLERAQPTHFRTYPMKFVNEEIIDHLPKPRVSGENQISENHLKTEYHYAGVSDRVKALFADLVVLGIFMFIIAKVFSSMENVPDSARIIAFIFVFFLYDPIFTSLFGGTIGHFMNGIRVKRENNQNKNVLFPLAIIRFAAKSFLGILSLVTISNNEKSKAIHDMLVGSVVIYKKK